MMRQFKEKIDAGGFFMAHWDGTSETEEKIKNETQATIRCIPLDFVKEEGKCMVSCKQNAGPIFVFFVLYPPHP